MERDYRNGLLLEYFTVAYNIIEAAVSIFFGSAVNSVALIGFGLDSIVESLSGMVLIWRLRGHEGMSEEAEERIERKALTFVVVTFFFLGAYVLFESVRKLYFGEATGPSLPGILIAIVSLIVMPVLAFKKYTIGKTIGSRALIADSKETLACSLLSAALLLGLGLNYIFGLWQADPVAGLVIVYFLFSEGREVWADVHNNDDD